jgi:ribosome-associated protein
VSGVSNITDYLVLATGNSEPHLRALRIEAEKVLDAAKAKIAGMEQGGFNSGWTVVDAYQVMVHLFTPDQRQNYALDKLWKDAEEVDLKNFVAKAAAVKPAAKKTKVSAPAPKVSARKKSSAGSAKPLVRNASPKKTTAKPTSDKIANPRVKASAKPVKKAKK